MLISGHGDGLQIRFAFTQKTNNVKNKVQDALKG
jgi:hypothetical protein